MYVRTGTTWTHQAVLEPPSGPPSTAGGTWVALSGDTAVLLNDAGDVDGVLRGAAYVFRRTGTTWVQEARVTPDIADVSDRFS